MKEHRFRIRVRYPETDRMGVVHHTHYLVWFEIGRTEMLRALGMPYADLEAAQVFMPVIEIGACYRGPVRYDEEVEVVTKLEEVTGVRVRFGYRLFRTAGGDALATGFSLHAAVGADGAPRRLPKELRERLESLVETGRKEARS
jgi:acyl-CoA thioester hydrolase